MNATFECIRQRVAKYAHVPIAQVKSSSRLVADLCIDGDDAWELLEELEAEFGPNREEFSFKDHFRTETELSSGLRWLAEKVGVSRQVADVSVEELYQLFSSDSKGK